jgi:voltage-gated potassium channel
MLSLREKVNSYLEDLDTSIGVTVNLTILLLVLLSLVIFVISTYDLPDNVRVWLNNLDGGIIIVFSLEYLVRFWCSNHKVKYLFSFFSLIDIIAIIPLALGLINISFIFILRWFRILRIFRFFKLEISIFNIHNQDGVIVARIFLTLFSIIFTYAGLIYQVEHSKNPEGFAHFFDALYFSVVTMTTVGFGDVIPLSQNGKFLTMIMILTGVILIPWQTGDLIKQFVRSNQMRKTCSGCGLSLHDAEANYCKICGVKLDSL